MGHSCISKGLMEKWSEGMGAGGLGRLFMGHPGDPQITPRSLVLSPTTGLFFKYLFIYLFIFGCVGSSFLCKGFL